MVERLRGSRYGELLARLTVGTLFATFAVTLLGEFLRTGHLTGLLLLVGESLVVVFTITRRRAQTVDRSVRAMIVTSLCLAGPFLLRPAEVAPLAPDLWTSIASALGLSLVVAGKVTLGRSFGLIPANRGVVVSGPYGFMRHPIYTGYLITHVAFLAAQPSPLNVAIILVADSALVARALIEERVLRGDAEYEKYCQRVSWHLVPGVF